MKSEYFKSLDFIKGILIILVILGHVLKGKINETLSRYFIYSFHMPMFIIISGFLFNYTNFLKKRKIFINDFIKRIFIPYIIANIIYSTILNIKLLLDDKLINFLEGCFKNIIYSYYHLWYIQGLIFYIILYYILDKVCVGKYKKLIISLIISIIVYYLYFIFPRKYMVLNIFLNNFRAYNLIFFTIGVMIRSNEIEINSKNKIKGSNLLFCCLLFFINGIGGFYIKNPYIEGVLFYMSNLVLGIYLLIWSMRYKNFFLSGINYLGKESLYFYLYHVIVILIARKLFQEDYYYLVNGVGILILVYLIKKFKMISGEKL